MQIQVTELEPCKLSVVYEADAEQILNKRGEIITSFKKAPVPGFRPGKASVDAIKRHYNTQIEESLKRALAEDAYHNTLFEKKIKPHGAPKFNSALLADGKFTCEFEVLTKPAFELASFKGMDIPKPAQRSSAVEISEKMLNEILPEAFAVIKETANRFKENSQIIVTATEKDREFSASKSYITLVGDTAVWANSWNAADDPPGRQPAALRLRSKQPVSPQGCDMVREYHEQPQPGYFAASGGLRLCEDFHAPADIHESAVGVRGV